MGQYLDIAKKIYSTRYAGYRPRPDLVRESEARSEKWRYRRDISDRSDRSRVRVDRGKVQHATLTVGEVAEEINVPNTGAAKQEELYRGGAITKENAIEWVTKAILDRRGMDTSGWRYHAPAVEAALTRPPDCDGR